MSTNYSGFRTINELDAPRVCTGILTVSFISVGQSSLKVQYSVRNTCVLLVLRVNGWEENSKRMVSTMVEVPLSRV